ncbi:MAG: hypothetical protein AB1467_06795 [Candidatus Diapherotrites archaeon]
MAITTHYTTPLKVQNLLQLKDAFSASTNPTQSQVINLIHQKENEIDYVLHHSYKLTQETEELRDIKFSYDSYLGTYIGLDHRNIQQLTASEGDSLQLWTGTAWEEWLGVKTEGRNNDYWLDYNKGILYLKAHYSLKPLGVKITYRYNGGFETQLNGALTAVATTITVDSTKGFPIRGWIRINDEEILYTRKTSTTFTGCTRGAYNTTASTHSDNDYVYSCSQDIEEACTKMVAAELLAAEDRGVLTPAGTTNLPLSNKIEQWKKDAEEILSRRAEFFIPAR